MHNAYSRHLNHLVWMAGMDKAYAWHRALQMDKCPSCLWSGIANDLVKIMKGSK